MTMGRRLFKVQNENKQKKQHTKNETRKQNCIWFDTKGYPIFMVYPRKVIIYIFFSMTSKI